MGEEEPKVRRLTEQLASQIAAGEVVERPASVVKELVENAIDSGAKRIEIRIEDGGRRLLEVVDDGQGMSPADALLAVERHTTSKLRTSDDLFDIATFGFRGEALASIASVSKFVLTTRRAADLVATRIVVDGGHKPVTQEVAGAVGTRVTVEDLFFNVPARLKFLKARATELGHVTDWITRIALAKPGVSFLLSEAGKVSLRAEATADGRERIAALLGRDLYSAMYPVEFEGDGVKVTGFAAGPQRANATSREIFTFVNGRFIRDRGLLHTISRAYDGVLQIGRSPACVLFIDVARDKVDVNVHPQKLEVRFSDARKVSDAVFRGLHTMLMTSPWLAAKPNTRTYSLRPVDSATPPERAERALAQYTQTVIQPVVDRQIATQAPLPVAIEPPRSPMQVVRPVTLPLPGVEPVEPSPADGPLLRFSSLRFLGQVHRTYLVCESPEGLILIDQHAGHERVLYEKYRAERRADGPRGQPFLVPVRLECSAAEAKLLEGTLVELGALGFEVEPFGGGSFVLKTAPSALEGADLGRVVKELAAEIRAYGRGTSSTVAEEALLARMSCHAAVRAGHPLDVAEAQELLRLLDGTPFGATCPHGRPVVAQFDGDDLKRMFARTYEGTPRASGRERVERDA